MIVAAIVVAILVLALAKRDDGPAGVERRLTAPGVTGAWVFRPAGRDGDALPAVIFIHGWSAPDPDTYQDWIDHLVAEGNEVIYPTYQRSPFAVDPAVLRNVAIGVRDALALDGAAVDRRRIVVAGHSAGGALAADYAASAAGLGLPRPRALMAVYPGRAIGDRHARFPEVPPSRIAAGTRILVLLGARDEIARPHWARGLFKGATRVPQGRKRLVIVRDPAVADHSGPLRTGPEARRAFWGPLDALIRLSTGVSSR